MMKITEEEWQKFTPEVVRMYKGKKTYFFNDERTLVRGRDFDCTAALIITEYRVYSKEERNSWEAIVILPGVDIIPYGTFQGCKNVETIIMADTVKRIEEHAFCRCSNLKYVRLSRNLEYIGDHAFEDCEHLTSIFIPPSCKEIDDWAFDNCKKLIIVTVPEHTHIDTEDIIIDETALIEASPFRPNEEDEYNEDEYEEINDWMKGINRQQQYALHRECASTETTVERIYDVIKRQGFASFSIKNEIGISPSRYLQENPFIEMNEMEMINRFVLDMIGLSDEKDS